LDLVLDGLPEETAPEPNELSPGAILPIGGGRVSLIADVPAGRMATLSIFQGADKVQVYRDATGGTPVLEQGRESMLIVGGSVQPFYVEATAPSLIQGDIQFLLTSGVTSILTETVVATAVRVDLDIDSNNNGSIDPDDGPRGTDDRIENTTSKPLVVNDNDSDLDGVPDYADWSIAGKRFTPLIIRVPASLPLASMQLAVSYAASAPDLIKPDYRLPSDSADRPLRIWTRNAMNREPASVTAGGSFVPEGRVEDLTTLGFNESARTVELYVEGIHTTAGTTAGVSRPISIQLFVGDRLTSTDLVSVSVVSNVLVIGIDGTDTRPWLTGANAKRANGLWNSHVRNLIADVEPYAMTIYRYGPVWTGTDSDDIQRDVVARANEIIRDAGGGTKVALVGWSRGAMIALWAANELSGPAAQVAGMHRTVEFVGLYDPVDMATAIPSDEHVRGDNAARIQPGIRRVTIVGPKETPNNNVDYPVGLPSYWTGLILTPDPVFVRMAQNDRITALGGTTVVDRIDYNASHGAIGGCPGYNVHLVSIPDGRYDYELDVERSVLSDKDIRNGMRTAGLEFVPSRAKDWYGFPTIRPATR
jgi:pimeloyl-ACP methyl ester carboxylesterase